MGVNIFPGQLVLVVKCAFVGIGRLAAVISFSQESVMEDQIAMAEVSPETFVAAMRQETEQMLREVMAAVNHAPDGAWINGSERQVRDLLGEYRRRVFEKALQMKTDAVEGAFSPGGPGDGPADAGQGH
jgi:hypothetical protein